MRTFAPEANGWVLQRDFPVEPKENVFEDFGELGNQISIAIANKTLRAWQFHYRAFTRDAHDYLMGFYNAEVGSGGRFLYQLPEFVPSPFEAPVLEAIAGGVQPQRSITVRFTWLNDAGETKASPTGTLLVPANNLLKVTLPVFPAGASKAIIYAAQDDPGNEQSQVTLVDNDRFWIQPDAPLLLLTTSPPTENTAAELVTCKFGRQSLRIARGIARIYDATLTIEEVYA